MLKNLATILMVTIILLALGQSSNVPLAHAQAFSCSNVTGIPQAECNELVTLYNSTNGANWRNKTGWLSTNTPCSWFAITCSGGHVQKIRLITDGNTTSPGNNLIGTIPNLSLPNLQDLSLGSNQLSGTIPNFSNLPSLTRLYLDRNQLSGTIPNFNNLLNLQQLILNKNQLSGTIPNFNLPKLVLFNLDKNQLSGSIPDFTNLPNLTMLSLDANQLSGTVPNFSNLPNLQELYLNANQLSGTIPNFSNLPNLTVLSLGCSGDSILCLGGNNLSGTIPNFSNLPNLTKLSLDHNQLSGTIPNLNWSSFDNLWLNNNCGLTAFDAAQATVLSGKDPDWQTLNPACSVTPLIFIPGVMGSDLYREGGEIWPALNLTSNKEDLSLYPAYKYSKKCDHTEGIGGEGCVYTHDVLRTIRKLSIPVQIVYDPLLNYLHEHGYANEANYHTTFLCNISLRQQSNPPNLFVFAYDWRLSITDTAIKLKNYVKCIQEIYPPNQKINILTHSMGGLVARRYILDNPNDNNVNALITIAAPWLGAPKLLYTMETGKDLVPWMAATNDTIKKIVRSSPAGYQLLPSKSYYDIGGEPVWLEDGWDINGNKKSDDIFDYPTYMSLLDSRYQCTSEEGCNDNSTKQLFMPGTIGAEFHKEQQDNWSTDTSTGTPIQYYHLYGSQSINNTIGQVVMKSQDQCSRGGKCHKYNFASKSYTRGDGTVPNFSATRFGIHKNYNAPNATLYRFGAGTKGCGRGGTCVNNAVAEHTDMTKNLKVQEKILQLLQDSVKPAAMRSQVVAQQDEPEPPVEAAYYLTLFGVDTVIVSDEWGNNTAPIPDTDMQGTVPEVSSYISGDNVTMLVMPTDRALTVTFKILNQPVGMTLDKGDNITATQAIRYLDTDLPAGVTARLLFNEQGANELRYDKDGDTIFESVVPPTVNVSGAAAQDITPPTVNIAATSANQISITAQDSESGVKQVLYSLDGTTFQLYTGPFTANTSTIYAFADDNTANRSSLVTYALSSGGKTYLPLIRK